MRQRLDGSVVRTVHMHGWESLYVVGLSVVAEGAAIWGYAFRDFGSLDGIEYTHEAWRVLLVACYAPLILWAPLLAAVTWAYWRRRGGESKTAWTIPPGASHGSTSAFARAGSR